MPNCSIEAKQKVVSFYHKGYSLFSISVAILSSEGSFPLTPPPPPPQTPPPPPFELFLSSINEMPFAATVNLVLHFD